VLVGTDLDPNGYRCHNCQKTFYVVSTPSLTAIQSPEPEATTVKITKLATVALYRDPFFEVVSVGFFLDYGSFVPAAFL
jgi:hypothetical protein